MRSAVNVPIVQRLKAVSDETRISILTHLGPDERCVCELTDALDIGQSLLSFHLRILKDSGLVSDRRQGRWSYYTVDKAALQELSAFIGKLAQPSKKSGPRRVCS